MPKSICKECQAKKNSKPQKVSTILQALGLQGYASNFKTHLIDYVDTLLDLNETELKELIFPLRDRKILRQHLEANYDYSQPKECQSHSRGERSSRGKAHSSGGYNSDTRHNHNRQSTSSRHRTRPRYVDSDDDEETLDEFTLSEESESPPPSPPRNNNNFTRIRAVLTNTTKGSNPTQQSHHSRRGNYHRQQDTRDDRRQTKHTDRDRDIDRDRDREHNRRNYDRDADTDRRRVDRGTDGERRKVDCDADNDRRRVDRDLRNRDRDRDDRRQHRQLDSGNTNTDRRSVDNTVERNREQRPSRESGYPTPRPRREEVAPSDTLFVGNLSFDLDKDDIFDFFNNHDKLKDADLYKVLVKEGTESWYCFLNFGSIEAARAAREHLRRITIDNCTSFADFAKPRKTPLPNDNNTQRDTDAASSSSRGDRGSSNKREECSVFVNYIPKNTSDEDIFNFFAPPLSDQVLAIHWVYDKDAFLGYAFIEFHTAAQAKQALQYDLQRLKNTAVAIRLCKKGEMAQLVEEMESPSEPSTPQTPATPQTTSESNRGDSQQQQPPEVHHKHGIHGTPKGGNNKWKEDDDNCGKTPPRNGTKSWGGSTEKPPTTTQWGPSSTSTNSNSSSSSPSPPAPTPKVAWNTAPPKSTETPPADSTNTQDAANKQWGTSKDTPAVSEEATTGKKLETTDDDDWEATVPSKKLEVKDCDEEW